VRPSKRRSNNQDCSEILMLDCQTLSERYLVKELKILLRVEPLTDVISSQMYQLMLACADVELYWYAACLKNELSRRTLLNG